MNLNEKLILTDCDGVLLDWVYSFDQWMARHGYRKQRSDIYDLAEAYGIKKSESKRLVRMFNESANIGYLPPFRDAIKYVRKLHEEHGFVFHAITSLSTDPFAVRAREENLKRLFGETAFERVLCLDTGADKDKALESYRDTYCLWVEDKPENAEVGHRLGLDSVLIEHDHNLDFEHPDISVAYNWAEIHEMFT